MRSRMTAIWAIGLPVVASSRSGSRHAPTRARFVSWVREVVDADGVQVVSNEIYRPGPDRRAVPASPLRTETLDELIRCGFTRVSDRDRARCGDGARTRAAQRFGRGTGHRGPGRSAAHQARRESTGPGAATGSDTLRITGRRTDPHHEATGRRPCRPCGACRRAWRGRGSCDWLAGGASDHWAGRIRASPTARSDVGGAVARQDRSRRYLDRDAPGDTGGLCRLSQAIIATAGLSPPPIRPAAERLATRLQGNVHPRAALLQFAEDVGDPCADRVVCALLLAFSARAQKLADLLGALADPLGRRSPSSCGWRPAGRLCEVVYAP